MPLMLFANAGRDLYQFCERCLGIPATDRAARRWALEDPL